MKNKWMLIGLLIITGCSKNTLSPTTYVEKPDKNLVRFVSEEYKFKSGNKFEYTYSSDNLSSSEYGTGNFKIEKHRLLLEFTDEPWNRPKSTLISKETAIADSSQNFYQVHVKTYSGINLPGVTILLTNVDNDIISGTATDKNGMAEIKLLRRSHPTLLKVSFIEFEDIIYDIGHNNSFNFELTLAEKYGTRITNKQMVRIKIKHNSIIIDNKEYQKATVATNEGK